MTPRKLSSKYNIIDVYVYTHTMAFAQDTQTFKPDKHPDTKMGKQTQSPTPKLEAICNWHLLGKVKSLLSSDVPWVCQSHSRAGSMPRNSWPTRNRLPCFMCAIFLLLLFALNLFLFMFFWCYVFERGK